MNLVSGRYNPSLPTPVTAAGSPVPVLVDAYGRVVTSPSAQLQLVDSQGNVLGTNSALQTDLSNTSKALDLQRMILAELRMIRLGIATLAAQGGLASVDDFDPGLIDLDPNLRLI